MSGVAQVVSLRLHTQALTEMAGGFTPSAWWSRPSWLVTPHRGLTLQQQGWEAQTTSAQFGKALLPRKSRTAVHLLRPKAKHSEIRSQSP